MQLKIFKFGGASVSTAAGMARVKDIVAEYLKQHRLLVVVSAIGKTTNALEEVVLAHHFRKTDDLAAALEKVKSTHLDLIAELDVAQTSKQQIADSFLALFNSLNAHCSAEPHENYNLNYDQVVSYGELFSTAIFSSYVHEKGNASHWADVRNLVVTDTTFREAVVHWQETHSAVQHFKNEVLNNHSLVITQGFLGKARGTEYTTTLGREGSDYTAAILAYCLDAEDVTIWKDVPGVLNADPRLFPEARKFESLTYQEAIEMTYYGATVIHPKTIQPLENKGIPLVVNSFLNPSVTGTVIKGHGLSLFQTPAIILVKNQILIRFSSKDFSFIGAESLSKIFTALSSTGLRVRTMQNSAISFSLLTDNDRFKIPEFLESLKDAFNIETHENVELVTLRHYNQPLIEQMISGKKILLEQRTNDTFQVVLM